MSWPPRIVIEVRHGFALVVEKPPGVLVELRDFDGVGDIPDTLDHPAEEEIREGRA